MTDAAENLAVVNAYFAEVMPVPDLGTQLGQALLINGDTATKVRQAANVIDKVNASLRDEMQERGEMEKALAVAREQEGIAIHAALHDALTGLPNRILFRDRLEHGLAYAKRHGGKLAVFFLDLDGFKSINDCYGHDIGDRVLQTTAARLSAVTRATDTLCRLGGDEFLYLALGVDDEVGIKCIADKLVGALNVQCEFDGNFISVFGSIGIAMFPRNGDSAEALLKSSDAAMYHAKRTKCSVYVSPSAIAGSDFEGAAPFKEI
ncbi:MAG: diguanylate cyclase domain-containing protein [Janthinobacterium lividum]